MNAVCCVLMWLGPTLAAFPALADGEKKPSAASTPKPTFEDVSYGPEKKNKLDFWQAKTDKPAPVVVFIHGGGGDKTQVRSQKVVSLYLSKGVHFASINFRTYHESPVQNGLHDCSRAIQFLRSGAKAWKIDKSKVAAYGTSAGAGATLWLAFHDDLADPKNSDPILRESSRLCAAASGVGQFSYDITKWEEVLGKEAMRFYPKERWPGFYGLKTLDDLQSPEGKRIRADVDTRSLITKDDPPVYLSSSFPDGDPKSLGQANHHPRHMMAIKKRCDEVGVTAVLFLPKAGVDKKPEGESMSDFILKHLGVK